MACRKTTDKNFKQAISQAVQWIIWSINQWIESVN